MKRLIVMLFILLFCSAAQAKTAYINDIRSITFRTGPGASHKVIDSLESGTRVKLLKEAGNWTLVRLADGNKGWVLSQYLTAEKPNKTLLENLQEKYEKLEKKADELAEENGKLKAETERLAAELSKSGKNLDSLSQKYDGLKKEATAQNVENLSQKNRNLTLEYNRLRTRVETIDKKLSQLLYEHALGFALTGAGILFLGIILGSVQKRQRRKTFL